MTYGNGSWTSRDVEAERLGQADADLDVLLQLAMSRRAHRLADEGALLRPPERVLDEDRQQPVRRIDQRALRLLVARFWSSTFS